MSRPVNVLVVDDSTFTRRAIIRMLKADPTLHVVAEAGDGAQALAILAAGTRVDVVTLDLEMPGLGGLATLEHLRSAYRVPVIVLSGAAGHGAAVTLQALDLGAFDVVAKPSGGPLSLHAVGQELVSKVRAAAGLDEGAPRQRPELARAAGAGARPAPPPRVAARPLGPLALDVVIIGISTGGPPALQKIIPLLPEGFPVPVIVLQHMPPGYTRALAERLDKASALAVREAEAGDRLQAGTVLVAPAGRQLGFQRTAGGVAVALGDDCPVPSFYRPCIDWTFQEAARVMRDRVLGVVMTGMGSDGAAGLRAIHAAGGQVWGQDESSSVIYGMPRAAAETGLLAQVFPLDGLVGRLLEALQ